MQPTDGCMGHPREYSRLKCVARATRPPSEAESGNIGVGLDAGADEFRFGLVFDPRGVAQALPKGLWKANRYTGARHV